MQLTREKSAYVQDSSAFLKAYAYACLCHCNAAVQRLTANGSFAQETSYVEA